jgi:hypothetical protein
MRAALLPLALVALALPAPALAFPYGSQPIQAYDAPQPLAAEGSAPRACNPALPVLGAVFGGTVGTLMASGSSKRRRNRRWTLPLGAAAGGLFGGAVSGC